MNFDNIFQNIALSSLWGLGFFLITLRDFRVETALVVGLLTFVVVLVTLWLIVEREFSAENAILIKAIMWGMGISIILIVSLILLSGALYEMV
jgi:hypothetical protein